MIWGDVLVGVGILFLLFNCLLRGCLGLVLGRAVWFWFWVRWVWVGLGE